MKVPKRGTGAEPPVVATKAGKPTGAKGWRHPAKGKGQPREREEPASKAKPFRISKHVVWEAYREVRANQGSAGVDHQSVEAFEVNLKDNLYKLWNRMSSGTYFPAPVRRVDIPKTGGGVRPLGIPTVEDRIAQAVAKRYLEPLVEPVFHRDSYGYRPGRSALDAVAVTRERCWQYDWVVDLDIRAFFDDLDHELVLRAVRRFTDSRWLLLYIERWLKAPVQNPDGMLRSRTKGTPQGGVISPLLANLFLHLAFDQWMASEYPQVAFARYADDIVVHCRTREEAEHVLSSIAARLGRCLLELHPGKTKIVYCKDDKRPERHEHESFDFLGYTFRPRRVWSRRGPTFVGFNPAVSAKASKEMRQRTRGWHLRRRSRLELGDIARMFNPVARGWIRYYGRFYRSALRGIFDHFHRHLVLWAVKKYKRFRGSKRRALHWLGEIAKRDPNLFVHWRDLGITPATG